MLCEREMLYIGSAFLGMEGRGGRQTDRQTDMFLFGVLYKESTLTTIPNS